VRLTHRSELDGLRPAVVYCETYLPLADPYPLNAQRVQFLANQADPVDFKISRRLAGVDPDVRQRTRREQPHRVLVPLAVMLQAEVCHFVFPAPRRPVGGPVNASRTGARAASPHLQHEVAAGGVDTTVQVRVVPRGADPQQPSPGRHRTMVLGDPPLSVPVESPLMECFTEQGLRARIDLRGFCTSAPEQEQGECADRWHGRLLASERKRVFRLNCPRRQPSTQPKPASTADVAACRCGPVVASLPQARIEGDRSNRPPGAKSGLPTIRAAPLSPSLGGR